MVNYQIYNENRKLYCGPRFYTTGLDNLTLRCTFDVLHRVGPGWKLRTVRTFVKSLRESHPQTTFTIHRITTKVEKLP